LILGLFKPDSGTVLFDGVDSRQYDPADIRSAIGAVMQDVWLFSGTVKENIVIGSDEASDQDVLDAPRAMD
jgi:ATP-binding cassette subfamily C protein LapB